MSGAEPNLAAASVLIGALIDGGVEHVVVSPGSRSTPLALALYAESKKRRIHLHVVLDERSAAFFALGIARVTGKSPLLVATSGTAPAHWYPAVIEASESELPLLLLTADRPPELHGFGAPQTVDQSRLFGVFARASIDLGVPNSDLSPAWLTAAAARALSAAEGVRPGPVQLNAAFREPLWRPNSDLDASRPAPLERLVGPPTLDEASLTRLARRLSVPRGLIVAGASRTAAPAIARLGAELGWPVLADPASGLRHGPHDRSALSLRYDAYLRSATARARLRPEAVLCFGGTPTSKPLVRWLGELGRGGVPIARVSPSGEIADPEHGTSSLVVSEPSALCRTLGTLARSPRDPDWLASWAGAERTAEAAIQSELEGAIWEGAIARAVSLALPDGALLHVGNGMPIRDLDGFGLGSPRSIRVIAQRGANGIDGHLSALAGEAKVWKQGPAVALLGDLALLHDLGGLRLVGEPPSPAAIVLVDNGGGGIFEFLDIAGAGPAFEPLFLTPQRADFEAIATGFGLGYRRVPDIASLERAIDSACAGGGPLLIHAPVVRRLNVERHKRVWECSC
jgi:2-succinyl-5-enolpyruvyl-6-hydroxy-3-cyclohexene-1-carboxylate synthase